MLRRSFRNLYLWIIKDFMWFHERILYGHSSDEPGTLSIFQIVPMIEVIVLWIR
jgi:hypothetical protein